MKSSRIVGALTAAAALAAPAVASAHPSVYTDTARAADPPHAELTRYVVANHGLTYVLRETNGQIDNGVFDYKSMPSALRAGKDWAWFLANGSTGAQAHATCNVGSLTSETAIKGWQGDDPFYAYVPFQKESAGIDDDPADWIEYVETLTDVDLETVANPEAACEALPGANADSYVPADTTQSSNESFNSGLIEHVTEPLNTQIATLTKAVTDAEAAKATLQGLLNAARAQIAKLATQKPEITMKATMPSARMKGRALARRGTSVTVAGVAGSPVRVELSIGERRARKLKLRSSVLARAKATIGADGSATVALEVKGKGARKALRKLKRPIAMEVTARSGDRIASSTGTLTR